MLDNNDIKLNIHPLLKVFENEISFFITAYIMMTMPVFQKSVVEDHAGKMSEITTSVKMNNFNTLKVDVAYIFNEFNAMFNVGQSDNMGKIKANFEEAFTQHGRLVAMALFNILESSKYNKDINKSKLFKFTKHLRNGSSHNNKFNFEGRKIKNVEWRGKLITHKLQGNQVFGNFIFLPDLFILINDISDILDRVDQKSKNKQ